MKEHIQGIGFSFLFLILSSFIVSIFMSILYIMNLNLKYFDLIYIFSEIILFIISGFIFGLFIKNKTFIKSIIIMMIYVIVLVIFIDSTFIDKVVLFTKSLLFIIASKISQKKRN